MSSAPRPTRQHQSWFEPLRKRRKSKCPFPFGLGMRPLADADVRRRWATKQQRDSGAEQRAPGCLARSLHTP
jgi:hypothetical protein